jgi:hypothetical protein
LASSGKYSTFNIQLFIQKHTRSLNSKIEGKKKKRVDMYLAAQEKRKQSLTYCLDVIPG